MLDGNGDLSQGAEDGLELDRGDSCATLNYVHFKVVNIVLYEFNLGYFF